MKKQQFIAIEVIVLVFVMLASVSAAGVVVPYMQDNILKVYPGDSVSISFELQNGGGAAEAVTFKASLLSGAEIASLIGDTFNVPANAKVPVDLRINIPLTAVPGTSYPISVSFVTVTSGEGGAVSLGTGMEAGFTVLVVERPPVLEKPAPKISTTVWIIIAIVIALIIELILWLLLRKKKK